MALSIAYILINYSKEALLLIIEAFLEGTKRLEEDKKKLEEEINKQKEINQRLESEIEHLKRESKRQAAPFSKGTRKKRRKKPGRKVGKGTFKHKEDPLPSEITEPPVDVPVTETTCPDCGGELEEFKVDFAYQTEIPEFPKPEVTQYRVHVCKCKECGKQVRGRHPEVAKDQYGATAHRMGDRVMATSHGLHYEHGVTMRKVPAIMREMTGVKITQSAIMQDAEKRAEGGLGKDYEQSRKSVKESQRVNTDDTGWKVSGEPAFLMAFDTKDVTVFQIRSQHRNEEVREIIPSTYKGVMGTDRGPSYDAKKLEDVKQQKCIGHILNNISKILEKKKGQAAKFGIELKKLLQKANKLWHGYHDGTVKNYEVKAQRLKDKITYHLRDRIMKDPDNQRLLNEIGWHNNRGNLLRFLDDPNIEPTNNRAEQALRPGVIARKVSQCSKNNRGANVYAVFKTEASKHKKAGRSVIAGFYETFQSAKSQDISP